jgi:hypothetical protein
MLGEFARERVAEYESLGEGLWENFDAPSRNSAPTRAIFDPGPEAMRLHRYFKDAERMRKQALDELYRLRRDEDRGLRPPPEPSRDEREPAAEPAPAQNEPGPPHPSDSLKSFGRPKPAPTEVPSRDEPGAPGPDGTTGGPGA